MKTNNTCQICNEPYYARPSQLKNGRSKFCSTTCKGKYGRSLQDTRGIKNPNWKGGVWKENMKKKAVQWGKDNPHKRKAHHAVETALKSGKLVKSNCVNCGTSEKVEGHHDDYDNPLDVKWLCRRCHLKHHRR